MLHFASVQPLSYRLARWMVVGALFCLVAPTAQAQGPQPDADAMFRQLDVNKDGKLTKAEVGANAKTMIDHVFRLGEKPDNGSMTREEFQVVYEKHRAGNAGSTPPRNPANGSPGPSSPTSNSNDTRELPSILRMLDNNNDQKLTRLELARLTQMFDRLDTNKDGALDVAELQAAGSTERGAATGSGSTLSSRGQSSNTTPSNTTPRNATERSSSATSDARAGRADTNTSPLAGVWKGWVVRGRGENPNEGEMEIELTVEGNRMTGRELGTRRGPAEGLGAGTFTMTGNGKSGNIDTDGTSGSQDGRHSMGIYELEGDTLKWCVTQRNRVRPTTMATDRGNYLLILRKQTARN